MVVVVTIMIMIMMAIIIPVLTRPGNCCTCGRVQVLSKNTIQDASVKWMKLGCVSQFSHWAHSTPSSGQERFRSGTSRMTQVGLELTTFPPAVQSSNHCATATGT